MNSKVSDRIESQSPTVIHQSKPIPIPIPLLILANHVRVHAMLVTVSTTVKTVLHSAEVIQISPRVVISSPVAR